MQDKMTSLITKIKLDASTEAYTFHDEEVCPTYINFFFGKNGAGKSSIADAFRHPECLEWKAGTSPANYSVLIYDKTFVSQNFADYGNLKGVFTLSQENVETRQKAEAAAEERTQVTQDGKKAAEERDKKHAELALLLENFQNVCWEGAREYRKDYDQTQDKKKSRERFTDEVLTGGYSPVDHDDKAIRELYDVAFDPDARRYALFKLSSGLSGVYDLSGLSLLGEAITSSGGTEFARFMKVLNASEWVRRGHDAYIHKSDGKCPFCQQKLPDDFESSMASAFDESYQESLNALRILQSNYDAKMQALVALYKSNLEDAYPKAEELAAYETKLAELQSCILENNQLIADKISSPVKAIALKDADTIIAELDELVSQINKQIQNNNDIVAAKSSKQNECNRMVWEKIAFLLKDYVADYVASKKKIEDEEAELQEKVKDLQTQYLSLTQKINDLNAGLINTADTVRSMNGYLKDSGFEGFSLNEKEGVKGGYEVIRDDGKVAMNLSEGERNFIAFLYFYHVVRGMRSQTDSGKNKIVVIDDPVSSMDSSALFIVGSLVREMIGICANVADPVENVNPIFVGRYIEQIFILTHNAYFHQQVAYDQVGRYRYVSLYKINKKNNVSTVELCVTPAGRISERDRNFDPVQGPYHALWREYELLDSPIPLMNVIRRILEHYFIQLCGYDSAAMSSKVLEAVKKKVDEESGDAVPDYTKYHLAGAMLSYIRHSDSFNEGLYFVDESIDCDQYREVFHTIFVVMDQEQHYKRMMEEVG
jgi:wobble nucleotide-excising tRNase